MAPLPLSRHFHALPKLLKPITSAQVPRYGGLGLPGAARDSCFVVKFALVRNPISIGRHHPTN